MTRRLLEECIRLALNELKFDRSEYEAAKATFMGKPPPEPDESKDRAKKPAPEVKTSKKEEQPPSKQQSRISISDTAKERSQDQVSTPKPSQNKGGVDKEKISAAALDSLTQKVLDELEKSYNDKKSVPKTRKFDDKSFVKDLKSYLKRETLNKDLQKLTSHDVAYLTKQTDYQFNRYIQNKVKALSK